MTSTGSPPLASGTHSHSNSSNSSISGSGDEHADLTDVDTDDTTKSSREGRKGYDADDDQGNSSSSQGSSHRIAAAAATSAAFATTDAPEPTTTVALHVTCAPPLPLPSLSGSKKKPVDSSSTQEEQHQHRSLKRRRTFSRHRMSSRTTTHSHGGPDESLEAQLTASLASAPPLQGVVSSIVWNHTDSDRPHLGPTPTDATGPTLLLPPTRQADWNQVFKLQGNPHRQLLRNFADAVVDTTHRAHDGTAVSSHATQSDNTTAVSEGFTSFFTTTESGESGRGSEQQSRERGAPSTQTRSKAAFQTTAHGNGDAGSSSSSSSSSSHHDTSDSNGAHTVIALVG